MFVNSRWAAILTRKTRKYWYFRWSHNPQEGRVPIKKLWRHIDTGSLALHYRSSMKYRRKKQDGRTIVLNNETLEANLKSLRDFMGFAKLPFYVNFEPSEGGPDRNSFESEEIVLFLKKANLKCYNVDYKKDTFLKVKRGRFEIKVEKNSL